MACGRRCSRNRDAIHLRGSRLTALILISISPYSDPLYHRYRTPERHPNARSPGQQREPVRPRHRLSPASVHQRPAAWKARARSSSPAATASASLTRRARDYIEGAGRPVVRLLGFSEKRLVEAAYARCGSCPIPPRSASKSHPTVIELAERLISLTPVPMSKVFFNNSGSEANDTRRQAGLVLQQRDRPAAQEEDHRPHEGLSRRHHRGRAA